MIFLLQVSITAIALFVTYASVFGLGALFATIAYPIMAAGVALELGKYVAVSYAYRQWTLIGYLERLLLVFFITLMMAFTSAGVFSYLGQSYQASYSDLALKKLELETLLTQADSINKRVAVIEAQITSLPSNSVTGRIRLMREYEAERTPLVLQLTQLTAKVTELKQGVATAEIHAGPITYIAKATGTTVEQSATWIILALTICLDPFALFLTVLMNKLLVLRTRPSTESKEQEQEVSNNLSDTKGVAPAQEAQIDTSLVFPPLNIFANSLTGTEEIFAEPRVLEEPSISSIEIKSAAEKPKTLRSVLQDSTKEKVLADKKGSKPTTKRIRKKPEAKTLPKVDLPVVTLPKPGKPQVNEV